MAGWLAGKRLLVVEESLKDAAGHYYEYVRAVRELSEAQGAEVLSAVHRRIDPELVQGINAIPAFARSAWDGDYYHPSAWRRYLGALRHNWLVYRTMSRIVSEHGPFDCLFAPTVGVHHVWGWRLLLARHGRRIGRMVLLCRLGTGAIPDGGSTPESSLSARFLGMGLSWFAGPIAKGKAAFATDSVRLSKEYEGLCGIAPQVFPSPRIAPFPDSQRLPKMADEPIVFSSLGPARLEKGIDLLQEAIKLCLARGLSRPVRFVIQWNHPIMDSGQVVCAPDPALERDPRVDFLRSSLDSEAYEAAIDATDCMVLPYRRRAYYARISGVAVEAATAGIPMIATRDTWTGDFAAREGAAIEIDDGDVEALAAAITEMAQRFDHFRTLAAERQKGAQLAHSSEAFLDCLWGRL